jgi:hypothetical protein
VTFRSLKDQTWYKFWYYNSFNTMSTSPDPKFYLITGTFYGLFRYRPRRKDNIPSEWTMVLASVSDLDVKPE